MTRPSSYSLFPVSWSLFTAAMPSRNPPLCVVVVVGGLRGSIITPSITPYEMMASPEREKHFVNVIHKVLTLPIDKILRKRGSG